jgi:hypothetical protein
MNNSRKVFEKQRKLQDATDASRERTTHMLWARLHSGAQRTTHAKIRENFLRMLRIMK